MGIFTSSRERKLWILVTVVVIAIFSTLFIGQPLAGILADQNIQAGFFVLGMILIGASILIHAINKKPSSFELAIWLGIVSVYIMLFLRLGIPERSHLIEYSVLAILIHKAILERIIQGKMIHRPAIYSFIVAFSIGVVDECIQILLPNRVFDPVDILFNGIAVTMAIGSSELYNWLRGRIKK